MRDPAAELVHTIDLAEPALRALPEARSAERPAPGKWSPREIVGHLIDSASNNHQRFIRAQGQEDLVLVGYDQERWVERQGYQDAPWPELVTLFALFNRHLARVMARIPKRDRTAPRARHNLHQLGWRGVSAGEPVTLEYLLVDYVGHLRNHLSQVLGPGWERS